MEQILEFLRSFNVWTVLIRLALCVVVGGIIGMERGRQGRAAGMRTHILVCMGAALSAMMGFFITETLGAAGDPMRISAQVVSGIGFLGVGTIMLKGRFQITGLTTAAGLWATAAIGLALGAGFIEGALIAFILSILTVTFLHKFETKLNRRLTRFGIYVEISNDTMIRPCINHLKEKYDASSIQVTAPRSGKPGNIGLEANIHNPKNRMSPCEISMKLEDELDYVVFAIESI
jgi:putative Mg2+ transporter-C (MgtC) family protein